MGYRLVRRDWEIPNAMLRIAENRVLGYLHNSQLYGFNLKAMLTAAYLQGVDDCAVATFKKEDAESSDLNLGAGI